MAPSGAHSAGTQATGHTTGMTPAQWYCLLAGGALLAAGVFGFIASARFTTGDGIQGDSFLGFEVNGWHNIVHLASGVLLLAAFTQRTAAKTVALVFGLTYAAVTVIGLADGTDVLGLIPVNAADNILHIALSLAGILAAAVSPRGERLRTSTAPATRVTPAPATDGRDAGATASRERRFDRRLDPRDPNLNAADRGEQPTRNR